MSAVVGVPKVRETGRASSDSPGLSSPPTPSSPSHTSAPQSRIHANTTSHAHNAPAHASVGQKASVTAYVRDSVDPVAKKARKKREPTATRKSAEHKSSTPTSATNVDGKESTPKTRRPRAPNGTGTTKRKSKNAAAADDTVAAVQLPHQSKITDPLAPPSPAVDLTVQSAPEPSQNGQHEVIDISQDASHNVPRAPTPRSSGQNYDPVRSSTIQSRSFPPTPSQQVLKSTTPPRLSNYGTASNSPSISSLIDPPSSWHQQLKRDNEYRPLSPPPKRQKFTPPEPVLKSNVPVAQQDIVREPSVNQSIVHTENEGTINHVSHAQTITAHVATPMDVDQTAPPTKPAPVKRKSTTSTGTATPSNTTKAPRQKETAMPVVAGNGLLSTEMFGGGASTGPEKTAPTVILDVPLNGEINKYVNFARLAEERYGFNALYPRLAAQRERLARVAAAGAALEKENKANGSGISGDEMSVDLSDGEGAGDDSNVEMGGLGLNERDNLGAGRSPAEGSEGAVVKRKKRVMKEDQYDKEDPFVDDTEMAWEEQQAASKDGFFVYSGPLVPEGEKPSVERYVTPLQLSFEILLTLISGLMAQPNADEAPVEVVVEPPEAPEEVALVVEAVRLA